MNVKELRKLLSGIDDDARVLVSAQNEFGDWAQGDVIEIAVTSIDGNDKVVALTNCVNDADGNAIFDAPAQFHRAIAFTDSDKPLKDQLEEGFSKPTTPVAEALMLAWLLSKAGFSDY